MNLDMLQITLMKPHLRYFRNAARGMINYNKMSIIIGGNKGITNGQKNQNIGVYSGTILRFAHIFL